MVLICLPSFSLQTWGVYRPQNYYLSAHLTTGQCITLPTLIACTSMHMHVKTALGGYIYPLLRITGNDHNLCSHHRQQPNPTKLGSHKSKTGFYSHAMCTSQVITTADRVPGKLQDMQHPNTSHFFLKSTQVWLLLYMGRPTCSTIDCTANDYAVLFIGSVDQKVPKTHALRLQNQLPNLNHVKSMPSIHLGLEKEKASSETDIQTVKIPFTMVISQSQIMQRGLVLQERDISGSAFVGFACRMGTRWLPRQDSIARAGCHPGGFPCPQIP